MDDALWRTAGGVLGHGQRISGGVRRRGRTTPKKTIEDYQAKADSPLAMAAALARLFGRPDELTGALALYEMLFHLACDFWGRVQGQVVGEGRLISDG